jgi:hypothetical protein
MAHDAFFLDPIGDVLPCNGMDRAMPMGNLREQSWDEIWNSEKAQRAREAVRGCTKQCWMMGSVGEEIRKHPLGPLSWVIRHKWLKREICIPPRHDQHPHGVFGVDGLAAKDTMQSVRKRRGNKPEGQQMPGWPSTAD